MLTHPENFSMVAKTPIKAKRNNYVTLGTLDAPALQSLKAGGNESPKKSLNRESKDKCERKESREER